MRTNIVLDDKLLARAMKKAGVRTMRETIDIALREYVGKPDYDALLALAGSGAIDPVYDPKAADPIVWQAAEPTAKYSVPQAHAAAYYAAVIADSSAWIAHLRASGSAAALRLDRALAAREPILLTETVLMEVLRGARDLPHFLKLERALLTLPFYLPPDPRRLARSAALLYARCRWAGVTPRSGNDCLIACVAIAAGRPLLHDDRDFEAIARVEPALECVPLRS